MANTSIVAAFERMWQHTLAKLSNYVTLDIFDAQQKIIDNKVDKIDGKGLSENDYTSADKAKVDKAENVDNKITEIIDTSTDEQYPSAKAVHNAISSKTSAIQTSIEELSADVAYINKEDSENIENPDVEMTSVVVDAALSTTSVNPVQNKVISEKINELTLTINDKESLPTVTSENNGQFLMVVDGAWASVTIENAEGGSF